jgi:rhodanese-related sulfurtransferase
MEIIMKKSIKILAALVASATLVLQAAPVFAGDTTNLPVDKQTKAGLYMTAVEAYEQVQKNGARTLFVDVRTKSEVEFLGMPTLVDANVPYMRNPDFPVWDEKKHNFKLEPNSDFASEIAARMAEKGLKKNDTVVLMCRSGDRSARAADLMLSLGYTKVYSVTEGFEGDMIKEGPNAGKRILNGWKNATLPWTYKLDKHKMYKVEG